jgi:starvation-inducible DNA-binding protein
MEELVQQMKVLLADTVTFSMKAHQYHWNVEGADFYEYHKFFELLYQEVEGAVDGIGEQIRQLDSYAPLSPKRIGELTNLQDTDVSPDAMVMIRNLYNDNNIVLQTLMTAYRLAERYNEIGLSNFIQDRTMAHKQHLYMLRASLKGEEK